jgi:hypothetical protein
VEWFWKLSLLCGVIKAFDVATDIAEGWTKDGRVESGRSREVGRDRWERRVFGGGVAGVADPG